MKVRALAAVAAFLVLGLTSCLAGKVTPPAAQLVDSGSFGIFVGGKRVATETFKIEQRLNVSSTHSEIKVEDGSNQITQTADMQLTSTGGLVRYQWQQTGPPKFQLVVEPKNEFLVEHIDTISNGETKSQVVPHILDVSTVILDDNFISHRELLVWRYLASDCTPNKDQMSCKLERLAFGALVPTQHVSATVYVEYVGPQKTLYKGAERELQRVNLQTESGDWALWLDDGHKLLKITIEGDNTEILRD